MSAPTHPRSPSHPVGSVETRLRWWAVALPAIGFVALLLLIAGPGPAHAATNDRTVDRILLHLHQTLG
jgi:hypothetical protein